MISKRHMEWLKDEYVLVVDDEGELRELFSTCLKSEGFQVIDAPDPVAAFRIFENQRIFLVISDYRMPKTNGANFSDLIKERDPTTPVIIVSGYAMEAARMFDCCDFPPDMILDKPLDSDLLLQIVEKFAQKRIEQIMGKQLASA